MNEQTNKQTNEWMNEWKNAWMNERTNAQLFNKGIWFKNKICPNNTFALLHKLRKYFNCRSVCITNDLLINTGHGHSHHAVKKKIRFLNTMNSDVQSVTSAPLCFLLDRTHKSDTHGPESNRLCRKTQMFLITGPDNVLSSSAVETKDGWFSRQRRVNSSEDLQPSINSSGGAPLFSPHQQRRNRLRLNRIDTVHVGWAAYTMTQHFVVDTSLKLLSYNVISFRIFFTYWRDLIQLWGRATLAETMFSLYKKKRSREKAFTDDERQRFIIGNIQQPDLS